jgi:uncharacterized membrane protein
MSLFPLGILSAAGAGGVQGDYELISTQIVVGSSTTSISFDVSSFASTYKHLQIRMTARNSGGTGIGDTLFRLNSDTGSNYSAHSLGGYDDGIFSGGGGSRTSIGVGRMPFSNQAANAFGASVIDILDPFSTTKNTTVRSLQGVSATNAGIELRSGAWYNTASVTTISLTVASDTLVAGSRFSIYGLRG